MTCGHCFTVYDETVRESECPHADIVKGPPLPGDTVIDEVLLDDLEYLTYIFYRNNGYIRLES